MLMFFILNVCFLSQVFVILMTSELMFISLSGVCVCGVCGVDQSYMEDKISSYLKKNGTLAVI